MDKWPGKVLITGGSGTIGSYIDFGIKPSRKELDIRDKIRVSDFVLKNKPEVIIHLAALTDSTICEENPKEAEIVNVEGTESLAKAGEKIGSLFVYLSTNSVFDGTKETPYLENDKTNPINNYGRTKMEAENVVRKTCKDWIIVRTAWVFGGGERDQRFVGKIIDQLKNKTVSVINDNMGTPTYAKDLVETIMKLIAGKKRGLFHITNAGSASRFDQAKFVADYFGYAGKLLPLSSDSFVPAYKQPKNEGLASEFLKLRPWQKALKEYLDENFKNDKR